MKWPTEAVQTTVHSPLGRLRLCATPRGLAGLWFHDQRHLPEAACFERWATQDHHPVLLEAQRQLKSFFAGEVQSLNHPMGVPLDLSAGTAFQREVWATLLAIPAGDTTTYGEVALRIGRPAAVRAVGAAVGRNPISLIVPCHRVLAGNGALTGYAGGLSRKTALLQHEGAKGAVAFGQSAHP